MPDDIISQYRRTYNSPIETNRQLATTTERNNIPSGVRWEGMIVYVVSEQTSYQLVGGVDNGSWELLGGLQDAPSDGQTYGRRNGTWELISSGGIQSVVAGDNITVDDTDPENPVVSAPDVVVKSSDSGTTGLILKGSTSGEYTYVSQNWAWVMHDKVVCFWLHLSGVNGSDPIGNLEIDTSGTTMPNFLVGPTTNIFMARTLNSSVPFYSIHAFAYDENIVRFQIQNTLDGSNTGSSAVFADVDFGPNGGISISGTYRSI